VKDLDAPVVIITGAGRGIGRCLANGLSAAGMRLVLMDLDEETLHSTASGCRSAAGNDRVVAVPGDITSENDAAAVVAAGLKAFGAIHALVNNAGIGRFWIRPDFLRNPIRFWEITPAQWRRFIEIDATGFFVMTSAVVPLLMKQNVGRIVTVTTCVEPR
jgi:NAD(P)-dependent dehydrogenase (short-subunit alcohol dehydrogenase family)